MGYDDEESRACPDSVTTYGRNAGFYIAGYDDEEIRTCSEKV